MKRGINMKLSTFACRNLKDIQLGINNYTWAVVKSREKAKRTNAKNVKIGNHGIFYCTEKQSLTTPFIFLSIPDQNKTIMNIWNGEYILPFRIYPLGNTSKLFHSNHVKQDLSFLDNKSNIIFKMKAMGTMLFKPVEITENDWSILVKNLAYDEKLLDNIIINVKNMNNT